MPTFLSQWCSRCSLKAMAWTTENFRFDSRQRRKFFVCCMACGPALEPTQPPVLHEYHQICLWHPCVLRNLKCGDESSLYPFVRMNCAPLLPLAFSINCHIIKNTDDKADVCVLPVFASPLSTIRSRSSRSKISAYCP